MDRIVKLFIAIKGGFHQHRSNRRFTELQLFYIYTKVFKKENDFHRSCFERIM